MRREPKRILMNVKRLIIKGKQIGQEIYLIGFSGNSEQGFIANLEQGLRWYPHSVHSILSHGGECWEPYDSPNNREILERVSRLKRAGE